MKNALTILSLLLAVTASVRTSAQCSDQVMHASGTAVVAGITVTVTSSGDVDTNVVYCASTMPYFIGFNYSSGSSMTGAYTFSFSPPVSGVTLNFSGLSSDFSNDEIVVLTVNNMHYAIPAAGTPNGCDPMAVLTPSGDVGACVNCGVSGWNGTTITGPISSLTVTDSVTLGVPNGSLFSLFICPVDPKTGVGENTTWGGAPRVFPNPAQGELTIAGVDPGTSYSITDATGRIVMTGITGVDPVNISTLAAGLYAVVLPEGDALRFIRQ
jgi:hypothetical protein